MTLIKHEEHSTHENELDTLRRTLLASRQELTRLRADLQRATATLERAQIPLEAATQLAQAATARARRKHDALKAVRRLALARDVDWVALLAAIDGGLKG